MSYCRWSSDDWRCDLYCYEHYDGGWTTHVAGNRVKDVPRITANMQTEFDEWLKQHREQMDFLDTAEREDIGLPHDGETFNDPTLQDFRARLAMLREVGYSFPNYVLDEVDEEIAQESGEKLPKGGSK